MCRLPLWGMREENGLSRGSELETAGRNSSLSIVKACLNPGPVDRRAGVGIHQPSESKRAKVVPAVSFDARRARLASWIFFGPSAPLWRRNRQRDPSPFDAVRENAPTRLFH